MAQQRPRRYRNSIDINVHIEGEPDYQHSIVDKIMAALGAIGGSGQGAGQLDRLTAREQSVAALLAAGSSEDEIADQLSIAVGTVHSHRKHIYGKLGIHSLGELRKIVGPGE